MKNITCLKRIKPQIAILGNNVIFHNKSTMFKITNRYACLHFGGKTENKGPCALFKILSETEMEDTLLLLIQL